MTPKDGYKLFASGMSNGLCNLVAGYAIGIIGYESVRDKTSRILESIFAEALGLYGLILAILIKT